MAFPTKLAIVGLAGCAVAAGFGLSQDEASTTISEQLGFDGYELISEKDTVIKDAWEKRVELYKSKTENLSLPGLPRENVDKDKLKTKCNEYEKNKITVKGLGKENYEKITVLCTLNIGEYIRAHLNEKDEVIADRDNEEDWKANFKEYKEQLNTKFKTITELTVKTELSKFCTDTFKLKHSNKNKEEEGYARLWCVKKAKPSTPKREEDGGEDES